MLAVLPWAACTTPVTPTPEDAGRAAASSGTTSSSLATVTSHTGSSAAGSSSVTGGSSAAAVSSSSTAALSSLASSSSRAGVASSSSAAASSGTTVSSSASAPADGGPPDANVDLGWPLDASLPARADALNVDGGGTAWTGWANVQYPPATTTAPAVETQPLYGQTWRAGHTEAAGQATGWRAELLVGPYGTQPLTHPAGWRALPAIFNVQANNNDEYVARVTQADPGLYGAYYRYQPPGGAWLHGDLNGSDDGIQEEQAALVEVTDPRSSAPLVVVSLNLRCLLDDWPARRPLVVTALARLQPDLVAFQEDCLDAAGLPQSHQVRAELGAFTRRGHAIRHMVTHTATSGTSSYQEGISVMSAWRITAARTLDLPLGTFPRKAWAVDVDVRGRSLRFYGTHLEFGTQNATLREQQAFTIKADFPAHGRVIVAGDFNATPETAAVRAFTPPLHDAWPTANPSQPGYTFPATGPTRRIDYILINDDMAAALLGARLVDETAGATHLSDHRGLAVAFRWP